MKKVVALDFEIELEKQMDINKHTNNLKKELERAGRTQKWLVKALGEQGVQMTNDHISRLCLQKVGTTVYNWNLIADLLESSLDDLIRFKCIS